jgi:hypothetical protein
MDAGKLARVIDRAKREIMTDVYSRLVPETVESFSQLHDHVDANGYGGAFWGIHDVEDTDFWNAVQDAVDEWIKTGGLRIALLARTLMESF